MEFKHFTLRMMIRRPHGAEYLSRLKRLILWYVKEIGGLLHLDQTPMLLDALAAIKALSIRVRVLEEQGATKVSVH